jgi:putative transcriptional regulator
VIKLRIKEIVDRRGLKITELAERADIAYGTAHALYRGHVTRIDLETLDRVCDALDVDIADLLVRVTEKDK